MTRAAQPDRGRGRRRGDHGLTTLEWLLITAAVAGLAALAVVLVQAYVEDTGDGISNPNPRVTVGRPLGLRRRNRGQGRVAQNFDLWADWERHFNRKCSLIAVLYTDAEVEVVHNNFEAPTDGGTAFDPAAAALADEQSPKARQGPGAMRGGLTLSRPGLPIGLGRRMTPKPKGDSRMQHSHITIESTPAVGSRLARSLGT